MRRTPYPFDMYPITTVRHEHGMTGSIAVDPERAVAAFNWALEAIDELTAKYAAKIDALEKELEEWDAKRRAEAEKRLDDYKAKKNEVWDAKKVVDSLLEKKRNTFWGLSKEDEKALYEANKKASQYVDYPGTIGYPHRTRSPREDAKRFRDTVETQLAQCAVALDCSHLDPYWAANIYRIEQGAFDWAEKQYPFNQYAKGE